MQVIEKMARPERFELPTFWFVAAGNGLSLWLPILVILDGPLS